MLIRYSCFFPRFILLVLLALVVWQGRTVLLNRQIVSQMKRYTGADVSIEAVRENLQRNEIVLEQVVLADPKGERQKLLQVEKITATFERNGLLYRRLHFPEITAEGIQIVFKDADAEQLIPDKLWTKLSQRLPEELQSAAEGDWTAFLNDKPEIAVQKLLQQLNSSRQIQDLKERYPKEIERFESAAALIKARFQNIKALTANSKTPSDKLQLLNEILKELDAADIGIRQLLRTSTELKDKVQKDYQNLTEAVKQDAANIKKLRLPKMEAEQLTEFFIAQEVREHWNKILTWGDWARSLLVPVESPEGTVPIYERFGLTPPKRIHGERIFLTPLDATPDITVDTVGLTGQILLGTAPIFFNGKARGIVSPMMLGSEPLTVQCCFSGAGIPSSAILTKEEKTEPLPTAMFPGAVPDVFVTLSIDRTAERQDDQLIVCCPKYRLPERLVGNAEKFAVAVSPSVSQLDGVLLIQGEKLSGQVRLVQTDARLSVTLPKESGLAPMQPVFQQVLDSLNEFTADVIVSGTRSQPEYTFKSNIAEKLRPHLEVLAQQKWNRILNQTEQTLLAEANSGTAILNAALQKHIEPVTNELNTAKTAWEKEIAAFSTTPLEQTVQQQLSKLSTQDRQRISAFLDTPLVQSLQQSLQPEQVPADTIHPDALDRAIQRGAEKLQEKLPGLLDKLRQQ